MFVVEQDSARFVCVCVCVCLCLLGGGCWMQLSTSFMDLNRKLLKLEMFKISDSFLK